MPQIVCDTNFLLKAVGRPLPSLSELIKGQELEIVTIPAVVRELEGLSRSKSVSVSKSARTALNAIGTSIRLVYEDGGTAPKEADIELFDLAKNLDEGSFIATLDGKLLSRFEKNKVPYLTLRRDRPFLRTYHRATYLSTKKKY